MRLFKLIFLSFIVLFTSCSFDQGTSTGEEETSKYFIKDIQVDKPSVVGGETFKIKVILEDGKIPEGSSIKLLSPAESGYEAGAKVKLYANLSTVNEGFIEYEFTPSNFLQSGEWVVGYISIYSFDDGSEGYYRGTYGEAPTYKLNIRGEYHSTEIPNLYININSTNQDTVFPELNSYSIDKTAVAEGERFTISINVSDVGPMKDNISGIKKVDAFLSPAFENMVSSDIIDTLSFVETAPGLYQATGFFTKSQTRGKYKLSGVSIEDNAYNISSYYSNLGDETVYRYYSDKDFLAKRTGLSPLYITFN